MTLIERLRALVAIDSTSARPNAPIIDLLERWLTEGGFRCDRHRYADDAGVEKTNLMAWRARASNEPAELALVGHTDCVPFDPSWAEALTLTEKGGRLFGRGACDTKAFVACAVTAALEARPARPLLLVFTGDEEVGCLGAKELVRDGRARSRRAIVGEPTSLRPIRAHKGYCLAEVEIRGVEGHSAYPESGASAIFRAGRFLKRLEERVLGELREDRDAAFVPPYTTLNVGVISGGKAKNIIPGSCRFTVEWRPIPSQPVDRGLTLLREVASEMKRAEPAFEIELRPLRSDRGVDTRPDAELVTFLEGESGRKPDTVSFGTEAPQLTELGAESVVFGPGDIQVAHRTGEFVPKDELVRCEEILARAIASYCGAR